MNEIARVKNEVKQTQWAEMVRQRNESGLTVTEWCRQNGINLKTYYYRLKRLRQAVCNEIEQWIVNAKLYKNYLAKERVLNSTGVK